MARIAALLALTVLIVAAGAGGAAQSAPTSRSKCQRLKGRDLAPARTVKLVKRGNDIDGTDLVGCVLPRGRVRTIAFSGDQYTHTDGYSVRQVNGRFVLVTSSDSDQYHSGSNTTVWDLRGGSSYRIAYECFELGGGDCGYGAGSTTAAAAFVTQAGRAVGAIASAAGPLTIAAFSSAGRAFALDAGPLADVPPTSLALAGNLASWTHSGQPRSANLRSVTAGG